MCSGSPRRRCCLAVSLNTLITNPASPLLPPTHFFFSLSSFHNVLVFVFFFPLHPTARRTPRSSAFLLRDPTPTPPAVMDATNVLSSSNIRPWEIPSCICSLRDTKSCAEVIQCVQPFISAIRRNLQIIPSSIHSIGFYVKYFAS